MQYSLHHVLVYYSTVVYFNVSLLAKVVLATLCDSNRDMEDFYRSHTGLDDSEFLTIVSGLNVCLETGEQEVMLRDPNGGPDCVYSDCDLLTYLFVFSRHSKNYEMMQNSSHLLKLLHKFLEVSSTEVQHRVVQILSVFGANHQGALKLCSDFPEILSSLENLTIADDDTMSVLVASTAEAILVNASTPCSGNKTKLSNMQLPAQ